MNLEQRAREIAQEEWPGNNPGDDPVRKATVRVALRLCAEQGEWLSEMVCEWCGNDTTYQYCCPQRSAQATEYLRRHQGRRVRLDYLRRKEGK